MITINSTLIAQILNFLILVFILKKLAYKPVVAAYWRHVQEQVQPCMLEWRGVAVGYCQFCRVDAESYEVPREEYERFALSLYLSRKSVTPEKAI